MVRAQSLAVTHEQQFFVISRPLNWLAIFSIALSKVDLCDSHSSSHYNFEAKKKRMLMLVIKLRLVAQFI